MVRGSLRWQDCLITNCPKRQEPLNGEPKRRKLMRPGWLPRRAESGPIPNPTRLNRPVSPSVSSVSRADLNRSPRNITVNIAKLRWFLRTTVAGDANGYWTGTPSTFRPKVDLLDSTACEPITPSPRQHWRRSGPTWFLTASPSNSSGYSRLRSLQTATGGRRCGEAGEGKSLVGQLAHRVSE